MKRRRSRRVGAGSLLCRHWSLLLAVALVAFCALAGADEPSPISLKRELQLHPSTDLWLRVELATLAAEHPAPLKPEPYNGPIPDRLATASPELQAAWRAFRAVAAPFERAFRHRDPKKSITYQGHEEAFNQLIDDLVFDRRDKLVEKIGAYRWANWCGTGIQEFAAPQSWGLFMGLIRERRLSEAAGAALYLVPPESFQANGDQENRPEEFLTLCGLDWETLYIGGVADAELPYPDALSGLSKPFLQQLVAHGSPRVIPLLFEITNRAKANDQPNYIHALSGFVVPVPKPIPPTSRWNLRSKDLEYLRDAKDSFPEESQAEVLHFLEEQTRSDAPFSSVGETIEAFGRLRRPETKETLHRLINHPSKTIAEAAAKVLRDMGETVTLPPKAGPVRFQIFLNGQPFANRPIKSAILGDDFGRHQSGKTDEEGVVLLDRDHFIDPSRKVQKVVFSSSPATREELSFQAEAEAPLLAEAIATSPTKPAAAVRVQTFPLVLSINPRRLPEFYQRRTITLLVRRQLSQDVQTLHLPFARTLTLGLQPGSYDLDLHLAGAARWRAENVAAKQGRLVIKLEPGADVAVKFVAPGKWAPYTLERELLRDGKALNWLRYFDSRTEIFWGLPEGHYIVRMPSSQKQRAFLHDAAPAGPEFGEAEVSFTVDDSSPAEIHLSDIQLPPFPETP